MKEGKQTREKLLQAAKEEFLEKGYYGASLRNICRNAGVTTGALYFFFEGKEDLFGTLVQEPLDNLYEMMRQHYKDEIEWLGSEDMYAYEKSNDLEMAEQMVRYIYSYHDVFILLLTKAQGSKYERCVEEFVEITEQHHRLMMNQVAELMSAEPVDDYISHWISYTLIFTFVQMIMDDLSEEEAMQKIPHIIKFLISGWFGLFQK